jgi:glucose-6-phosphate 1-dehydrogenase
MWEEPPPLAGSRLCGFLGATGDLAYKQIFPARRAMIRHGHLDVPILGVAKAGWTLDQLRARARESTEAPWRREHRCLREALRPAAVFNGDYGGVTTFERLRAALGSATRPLFYLVIPPSLFAAVAAGLGKSCCARNARVVFEKPFGRIDHFLGKEPEDGSPGQ